MNFKNLIDAVTLTVGYQREEQIDKRTQLTDGVEVRQMYWLRQVEELRSNSGFDTEAEFRLITAEHVIEAVAIKLGAYEQAMRADDATWVVVNSNNNYRIAKYESRGAASHAMRRARKENANYRTDNAAIVAKRLRDHLAAKRAKLVQNLLSKQWVMENTHTPWTSSVQSETYWSA